MITNRIVLNRPSSREQRGAVALMVILVLLIAAALVTVTTSRTGIIEQKITGNDLRAREVQEAAEAGLEYGVGWATDTSHQIDVSFTCPGGAQCPDLSTALTDTSSGENYSITALAFDKGVDFVKVTSTATSNIDTTITATAESYIKQVPKGGFNDGATSPRPWVLAGCLTTAATGTPSTFLLAAGDTAAITGSPLGSGAGCLPQGHLDTFTWQDSNNNGIMDSGEDTGATPYVTGTFPGCPALNCVWDYYFKISLQEAKDWAADAGHEYTVPIPCGAATSAPSIYVVNNSGPINPSDVSGGCTGVGVDDDTIGAPGQPIVIIIPAAYGCPKFNGGITVFGIVYYESTVACSSEGWGGATVYGSVMWEGNVDKPNASSQFISVNYGNNGTQLDNTFNFGIDDTVRVPGTWKDF